VKVENKEKHKDKLKEKKEKKEKKKEKEVAATAATAAVGVAPSAATKVCRTIREYCLCMFPYSVTFIVWE
jgi:precorrin isomerase